MFDQIENGWIGLALFENGVDRTQHRYPKFPIQLKKNKEQISIYSCSLGLKIEPWTVRYNM